MNYFNKPYHFTLSNFSHPIKKPPRYSCGEVGILNCCYPYCRICIFLAPISLPPVPLTSTR
ncbi:MAG: hypothetical protein ACRDEB_00885, partial [Chitinophagaceae bacterium]